MGGADADGFIELHLHRNGIGMHRRSRLPGPHLRHAEESPEACLQHVNTRREECAPAAPGDSGGAIAKVSMRSGEGGGARGGRGRESDRAEARGGGVRLYVAVMAEARGRSRY